MVSAGWWWEYKRVGRREEGVVGVREGDKDGHGAGERCAVVGTRIHIKIRCMRGGPPCLCVLSEILHIVQ